MRKLIYIKGKDENLQNCDSAEYRVDEEFQNFTIFGAKFWFCKLKKF